MTEVGDSLPKPGYNRLMVLLFAILGALGVKGDFEHWLNDWIQTQPVSTGEFMTQLLELVQKVNIGGLGAFALQAACLIPTRRFLVPRLDKIADQDPSKALESRERILQSSATRGDHILFCHDPAVPTAHPDPDFARFDGGLKEACPCAR